MAPHGTVGMEQVHALLARLNKVPDLQTKVVSDIAAQHLTEPKAMVDLILAHIFPDVAPEKRLGLMQASIGTAAHDSAATGYRPPATVPPVASGGVTYMASAAGVGGFIDNFKPDSDLPDARPPRGPEHEGR